MARVSMPLFLGSLAAAGALGYMTGARNNTPRLPNPEWDGDFSKVVEAFGPYSDADLSGLARELEDTDGWTDADTAEVLERMERLGYVVVTQDMVSLTPEAHTGERFEPSRARNPELEENPTGYPMSAGQITEGPHAGKVMYRPKIKDKKERPRIYVEPGSAESLEAMTEDTVDLRQEKAGKKRRRGKTKAPAAKKAKKAKAAAKPKAPKAAPKPKAPKAAPKPKAAKAEPEVEAAPKAAEPTVEKTAKKAPKKAPKKKKPPKNAPKKAPPRVANPGPVSVQHLMRRLEF